MEDSLKGLPEWLAQAFVVLNVVLGLAAKFGGLGVLAAALLKGWHVLEVWIHDKKVDIQQKLNDNTILARTTLDDVLLNAVEKAVLSTGQDLYERLKKQVEAGKLDPAEFKAALHTDAKAKFLATLSEDKKKYLEAGFKDLNAAFEAAVPGVVKKLKDSESLTSPNS